MSLLANVDCKTRYSKTPNRWMLPASLSFSGLTVEVALQHRMVLMRAFNKASWMGSEVSDVSVFLRPMAALACPKEPKSFTNTTL